MDPKIAAWVAAPTIIALLSGCTLSPASYSGTLCSSGPIILDSRDALTRSTTEQIVTINNSGEKLCGWKAPK